MFKNKTIFGKSAIILFIIILLFLSFTDFRISLPAIAIQSVRLPIIMYHNVSNNTKYLGKYTISPSEFEEDIIHLKKMGYTTIGVEDLIAFEYNNVNLPEKPIMLTFDDGYSSNYKYIVPILKKYDCKAVISIVGEYVDKSTSNKYPDPYMNWSQIKELVNSPNVEIQNHTYSMHKLSKRKGCRIIKGESYDEYKNKIINDIGYLQDLIKSETAYTPKAFTYPYGFSCKECRAIIKDIGFLASFTSDIGINYLSGKKNELYELKRINRKSGIDSELFIKQFEK